MRGRLVGNANYVDYGCNASRRIRVRCHEGSPRTCTVKKKGPRDVKADGCYSPGGVLVTHKGVLLTSMSVGKVW